jgi:cyclic di-GMP phosphodiesterase
MDLNKVKTSDLKIGMFIELPNAWRAHPLLRNNFIISSYGQIQTLIENGVEEVNVDESKSNPVLQEAIPDYQSLKKLTPEVVHEKLKEVIQDKKMPPEPKAQAVHVYSVSMINKLWDKPTAENIGTFKKNIVDVVDLILGDDATNQHLLQLTSHDYDTYIHSVNVGVYGVSLAKALFVHEDKHDMHALGAGFFLHDIGKVEIDEAIINKPGKLTEEEMNIMRRHPALGFKILSETKQISEESRLIVLQHHEREDSTGYPKKLRGDEIHIYGRICSVADVFDALVSKRPYRKMLNSFDALKLMKEEMLNHFHRPVFEKFVLLFK